MVSESVWLGIAANLQSPLENVFSPEMRPRNTRRIPSYANKENAQNNYRKLNLGEKVPAKAPSPTSVDQDWDAFEAASPQPSEVETPLSESFTKVQDDYWETMEMYAATSDDMSLETAQPIKALAIGVSLLAAYIFIVVAAMGWTFFPEAKPIAPLELPMSRPYMFLKPPCVNDRCLRALSHADEIWTF